MKLTEDLLKQIRELNIDEFKKEDNFDKIGIGDYLSNLSLKIHRLAI